MRKLGIFLRLVYAEWASLVTGAFSAILIVLGIGISIASAFGVGIPSESIIQLATWTLAAVCGARAAYLVWVHEYDKRTDVEAKLEAATNPVHLREIEAQEQHTEELRRHTAALERDRELPPMIKNIMDLQNRRERIAMGLEPDPNKPPLTIRISEGSAYDGDADQQGEQGIHVFLAELTGGDRSLSRCQVHLENSQGHKWVLSKPFDLRPGEPKTVPLIRYKESQNAQESRAFIYMLRDNGERAESDGRLILRPDRFTVKVLSQEAKPVMLSAQLSKHPTCPGHWILEEVPHAPKA